VRFFVGKNLEPRNLRGVALDAFIYNFVLDENHRPYIVISQRENHKYGNLNKFQKDNPRWNLNSEVM